jgi:hypothetical protein
MTNNQKHVGIIFSSLFSLRNWVESNTIQELAEDQNLKFHLLCTPEIYIFAMNTYPDLSWERVDFPSNSRSHGISTYANAIVKSDNNKSYKFWIKRMWFSNYIINRLDFWRMPLVKNYIYWPYWIITRLPFHIKSISKMSLKTINYYWKIKAKIMSSQIAELDLVVIISGGLEPWMQQILLYLENKKTKTLVHIENWDNLSSKTSWGKRPDYLTVMGSQSKEHAIRIHSFNQEKVIVVGGCRFKFFQHENVLKNKINIQIEDKKFRIFYIGGSLPHNEKIVINNMVTKIDSKMHPDSYEIKYRPHPQAIPRLREINLNERVVIDSYYKNEGKAWPKLNYDLSKSLLESNVIIASPSSIILEIAILGQEFIIDGTNDGVHRTTSAHALKSYEHFKEIVSSSDFKIAWNEKEIEDYILKNNTKFDLITEYPTLKYLVEVNKTFPNKLLNAINHILIN